MFHHTAHVYDLIYEATGKDYSAESSAVHSLIQERKSGARSLLDVACGTGGHLRHLQRWYTVTGVDLDPAMLEQAKRHLPTTPLVQADMRQLHMSTTFDAVTCLFSSIGYMRNGDDLDRAVAAMARHLNHGGVLIIDGWVRPDEWREGVSAHVEVAERGALKVVRVSRSRREGAITVLDMHHLIADEDGIEHVVDHHELTLFSPEEYQSAFRRAGLAVEVVDGPLEGRDRYVGVPVT
jgi:SAM-dependent methyltransferase